MAKKLRAYKAESDKDGSKNQLDLDQKEEELLEDIIIDAEHSNIWAILMPAVYMHVPGSMIAKLW